MSARECIVDVPASCHFTLDNLPFGVFSIGKKQPSVGVAIGEYVLDLSAAAQKRLFDGCSLVESARDVFSAPSLNHFMALGRKHWREARKVIQGLLTVDTSPLTHDAELMKHLLIPLDKVKMHLPFVVGDYTDFYSSKEHAVNVGTMFRGKDNALQPNWLHLPVGYHGRSSSIIVSETAIKRPAGQIKPKEGSPVYKLTEKLDFELEMAFVVGVGNNIGEPIKIESADEHIFGVVLMNDWSARDIQSWEYVPLGPFLGKNFGTVISPWVVTLDALAPFITQGPIQDPAPLPYLAESIKSTYNIDLKVWLENGSSTRTLLCNTNLKHLYWSFRQQLVHHTASGCNMRPGDLCGSGTISGPTAESLGSMLEISWNGEKPIKLSDGTHRAFIEDGDTVIMSGVCESNGIRVGFGECVCPVEASLPM